MSTREIPEHWARRLVQRGYVRSRGSGPNLTAFAQDIGLHTTTVSNALRGGPRSPDPDTVARIVDKLGPDTAAWFGAERVEPWVPPAAASLLSDRQRKVLNELIQVMTERRVEESDPGGNTAPTTNVSNLPATRPGRKSSKDQALTASEMYEPAAPGEGGPDLDQLAAYTTGKKSRVQQARERQDKEAGE